MVHQQMKKQVLDYAKQCRDSGKKMWIITQCFQEQREWLKSREKRAPSAPNRENLLLSSS